ncbi:MULTISPECIES: class I SAM-dependent methyltransferase [unclassified Pseudomonas]|jgi:SAM-dependent methyltransferase|uniref:class I SAM-dependent methyltransferase n=1 Tax=unclassified Pseudomonas TaxID=196821 RepID=UPI002002A6C2|nr:MULTISPECIES: class I SAM-dependent methyltransferase [unclassified Pseudomonas]MCK6189971.1 class I SAM-dependent methyltransferase [Pseudomonas sp. EYE_354]WLH66892.1 class I SAM-dependent methyltransferase [Pseudomonas sp. FP2309]
MSKSDAEYNNDLLQQLRLPYGASGVHVAALMHESNANMTHTCFSCVDILPGDTLLEIGHGNGAHVPKFFETVPHMRYQGLEVSWLMHHEAMKLNEASVANGTARFKVYDGKKFPFNDQVFEKIITVNTLYFLSDLVMFLSESYRTLKVGGKFGIAFASREFMRSLSFIPPAFNLYEVEQVKRLISNAGFVDEIEINVHERSIMGNELTSSKLGREFSVIVASKSHA